MAERHVKRFVFGKLLPIRGVDNVWERRYGWHWVVEREELGFGRHTWLALRWTAKSWLNKRAYKDGGYVEAD